MNAELTENVQDSIRPGEMVDTYYYGETNSEKQAYPCVVNNKFRQAFTNLSQGTSQFVISPYQGVSDIVIYMRMPDLSGVTTGYALPQSWGYSLIKQVSVRYGSSAQYFFTGEQIYLQNLWDCEDAAKRDQMASLGGNALANASFQPAAGANQVRQPEAFLYLNLPHNSPRADGKPLPFPSDLLVQPIIITVELNSTNSVFVPDGGAIAGPALPTSLADAQLQVKQEMMSDSADLLARRVDMNTHAYTFPLKYFPQQEVQIDCGQGGAVSVNLTGFRAGEVRNILLWATDASGVAAQGSHYWLPIKDIQLTYNGEIFYRTDSTASQIWNLVCDTKSAGVNSFLLSGAAPQTWATNVLVPWTDIPFAQVNVPYDKEVKLVHGKPILNAVVNLTCTLPTVVSPDRVTLHAVYLYNSSLLCSRGGAEYIF
jgi:hypothetical protein